MTAADSYAREVAEFLDVWDAAPAHRTGYRDAISSQKTGEDGRKLRASALRGLLAARADLAEKLAAATRTVASLTAGTDAVAGVHHCAMCGERCYWQECPTGGWWAHEIPSGGDHDAVAGQPCQPGTDDHCEPPGSGDDANPDVCRDCYGRGDDFEDGTCGRCRGTGAVT